MESRADHDPRHTDTLAAGERLAADSAFLPFHSVVHSLWRKIGETKRGRNRMGRGRKARNPQVTLQGGKQLPDLSSRAVLSLAVPALGALIIEPLLLLIDSMMVGHLGTASLAGLSLASTILTTLVGIFVFLAYATTALTARALGEGSPGKGLQAGIDAMWLALGIGGAVFALLIFTAPQIVVWMGAGDSVQPEAVAYLRGAAFGMIPMLIILAATGTLRGVLDMKTPLYVLAAGSAVNVALNFLLIFALHLGIRGAGIALSITQTLMCLALVFQVVRKAGPYGVTFRPSSSGLHGALGAGLPLLVRTLSLRAALLATVAVATRAGVIALAGHQVVSTVWTLAAFALDALAIAAQSLVGVALGSGRQEALRSLVRRMTGWGVGAAALMGLVVLAGSPWIPLAFGTDPAMHVAAADALRVAGIAMPIAGAVFILDGVLIGASQGKFLAWMGLVTLAAYLPALWVLQRWIETVGTLSAPQQAWALSWLWAAFAGWFMLARAATNAVRALSPNLGAAGA